MKELATFGAGCFWGVEEAFRKIHGVIETKVGFMGGTTASPSYEQVCTDQTGHAEVVQLVFDPEQISYEELLQVFWNSHNPTTLNRQGPDVGSQYRSVIFCHNAKQEETALRSKERLTKEWAGRGPIVTEIMPPGTFYPAEEYHQKYLEKKGRLTCHPQ